MQDGEIISEKKETIIQEQAKQLNPIQIREKIDSFLINKGLSYDFKPDKNTFFVNYKSSTDEFSSLDLQITLKEHFLVISFVYFEEVPTNKINQISELIARINCYVILGHFNLYYSERLIVHQSYLFLTDGYFTDEILDSYIEKSVQLFETFRPIILKVIENNEEPILALLDFEMNN